MKLIFLDIDGVLNSQLWFSAQENQQQALCNIDPSKVELLNDLISTTGAKVVISSTWRMTTTIKDLQNILEQVKFKGEIIGFTPVLRLLKIAMPRGVEILCYLKENYEYDNFPYYVILDDKSDMLLCQRDNFFLVDPYCGLTPRIIYNAIRFLVNT